MIEMIDLVFVIQYFIIYYNYNYIKDSTETSQLAIIHENMQEKIYSSI